MLGELSFALFGVYLGGEEEKVSLCAPRCPCPSSPCAHQGFPGVAAYLRVSPPRCFITKTCVGFPLPPSRKTFPPVSPGCPRARPSVQHAWKSKGVPSCVFEVWFPAGPCWFLGVVPWDAPSSGRDPHPAMPWGLQFGECHRAHLAWGSWQNLRQSRQPEPPKPPGRSQYLSVAEIARTCGLEQVEILRGWAKSMVCLCGLSRGGYCRA